MSGTEEKLKEITGIVFNNWYALKIALDHGQGGPPALQCEKVEHLLNSMVSMVLSLSPNDDFGGIGDYLEDFMDDEFNIVLEDDSQLHVTEEIYNFSKLLQAGNDAEVISKLDKLPVKTSIVSHLFNKPMPKQSQMDDSSDSDSSESSESEGNKNKMDEDYPDDPGWTVVRNKRK